MRRFLQMGLLALAVAWLGMVPADAQSEWHVTLDPFKTSSDSQAMPVVGKNMLTRSDILAGEVWIGSDCSNMEWIVWSDPNGQELPWTPGSTTIAVLPDTQYYTTKYPDNFEAQTRWIAENHEKRNITYVWHLGDITQDDAPAQWEFAKRCFDMIEGKVPYLLVPGNHDYSGELPRSSRLSEYFPVEAMEQCSTFGETCHAGKLDNNYHLFRIGDQEWIALGLEYGPREEVVAWASGILDQHADRYAAVVTHAYLFRDNVRYDHTQGSQRASPHGFAGDGNDGEELWQKLIRKHRNVMIVIGGHVRTGGPTGSYLASEGDHGNIVHQMMTCYQKLPSGGRGYLRTLEFLPDCKTVQVRTFSPSRKTRRTSEWEDFTFELQGPTRD